jgi:hypothetical protein
MSRPLILRNRAVALLWLGQVGSQAGTQMYRMAMLWWILTINQGGTGLEVGLLMVFGALPSLLFVTPIGRLVETTPSRRVLIACDLAAAAVVGFVSYFLSENRMTPALAYLASFLLAAIHAVFDPALNKALPKIVEPEDLEGAIALQSSTQSLASFGGAVGGAILVNNTSIFAVALLNDLSYLVSALCVWLIAFRPEDRPAPKQVPGGEVEKMISGWAVLDAMPLVKRFLIGFGMVNFFTVPTLVVLPVYTHRVLHGSPAVLGALEASLWIGLLAGAFSSRLADRLREPGHVAAVCIGILGLGLLLPGLVVNQYFYMGCLFVAGMALGINNVKFIALFQQMVAPEMKGRFFAVLQATVGMTYPLAYAVFGFMTRWVPATTVCVIQGAGAMLVASYFLTLRQEEMTR